MTVAQGTPRTDEVLMAFDQAWHRARDNGEDLSKWEGNLEMRLEGHARELERAWGRRSTEHIDKETGEITQR